MDTTYVPDLIRDNAPRHATRLDLVSATRRSQGLALSDAQQKLSEAFQAADDLVRALRRFQALHTGRPQEMRDWLCDVSGGAIDQLGNVMGAVDRDLEEQGLNPAESIDLSDLYAFWESVK